MELYLIRHGETEWNKQNRLQGNIDVPLSAEGIRMAECAAERLSGLHFDKIFSSPLSRAFTTAEIICKNQKDLIKKDERLREISFGSGEGSYYSDWIKSDSPFKYFFSYNQADLYVPPAGGERLEELYLRTSNFIQKEIEPFANDDGKILIVAHGALLSSIMCYLDKRDIAHFWGDGLAKNCQEVIYDYDKKNQTWQKKVNPQA